MVRFLRIMPLKNMMFLELQSLMGSKTQYFKRKKTSRKGLVKDIETHIS
jgi:hypothetical protein